MKVFNCSTYLSFGILDKYSYKAASGFVKFSPSQMCANFPSLHDEKSGRENSRWNCTFQVATRSSRAFLVRVMKELRTTKSRFYNTVINYLIFK